MKLKVLMKSGNSFEVKCTGWKLEKNTTTQLIDKIEVDGGYLPPYMNLNEIEAIVRVR